MSVDIIDNFLKTMYQYDPRPSQDRSEYWKHAAVEGLKSWYSNQITGKWCIFHPSSEVDEAWEKISKAVKEGKLGAVAKVSTWHSAQQPQYKDNHVICVYTDDYTDEKDVRRVRDALTDLGYLQPLKYKRDIDTRNRVEQFIYEY